MIETAFIADYAPILVLLVSFILCYAALTALKVPGNNLTLAILSALLSLILVSSANSTDYIFNLFPIMTVVMLAGFFIILALVLLAAKIDDFRKPVAWIGFAILLIVVITIAFSHFNTLGHLLPNTSDSGLNSGLREFKDWIYGDDFSDGFLLILSVAIVGFFMLKKAK